MIFRVAALVLLSASGTASSTVRSHRRLSYERIVGYEPGSQVTDHAAIDLDQKAIETELKKATDQGFTNAKNIYEKGGNSKSFARVNLGTGLTVAVPKGTVISGINSDGLQVMGKAKDNFGAGATEIDVQYQTSDSSPHVTCRVGALTVALGAVTQGCLAATGTIKVGEMDYAYTYDVMEDNMNGRTLMGFSTAAQAKMYACSNGCPHDEYMKFYNYYGQFDYAHQWVNAAMTGGKTDFTNGNADFGIYGFSGKTEASKKGIAYLNVYMYVLREFEDAINDCQIGCTKCNDDPVHAWDEGVAYYAGSIEGATGEGGKLLYSLAEKRCGNFKTCGGEGGETSGKSQVNTELLNLFTEGKNNLLAGKCDAVKPMVDRIADIMSVPLIQGTLRYGYKVDRLEEGEKGQAEGAVFAAAVLPRVHACSATDAKIIYDNMGVSDSPMTDFVAVKKAFENNYNCMGLTCEMVGGLLENEEYYEDAAPCGGGSSSDEEGGTSGEDEEDSSAEEGGTSGEDEQDSSAEEGGTSGEDEQDSSAEIGGSSGEDEQDSSGANSNAVIISLITTALGAITAMLV